MQTKIPVRTIEIKITIFFCWLKDNMSKILSNFLNRCNFAFDCVHTYGFVCQRQILDKNDTPSFKWGLETGYLPIWGRLNLELDII